MRYVYILVIALMTFISCNKDPDVITHYMSFYFKDFVVFPKGSYWLYQDTINLIEDSVSLVYSDIEIESPPSYSDYGNKYEILNQNFESNAVGDFSAKTQKKQDYFEYLGRSYFYDSTESNYSIRGSYYQVYDSLKILNNWYEDVICIKESGNEIYHYWCRNIGVIRIKDDINNNDWLLVRHFINR